MSTSADFDEHKATNEFERAEQVERNFRELDGEAIDRISEKYGHIIGPDRIRAMKDLPSVLESQESLEHAFGASSVDQGTVLGFSRGLESPAHILREQPEVNVTLHHERMHQAAHPNARAELGEQLDEGMTEKFALDTLSIRESELALPAYSRELEVARALDVECGTDAAEKAYFEGDANELRTCLEEKLGRGALDQLKHKLQELDELESREQRGA